jgi:DNA-binding transcriptional ArsR family regulator
MITGSIGRAVSVVPGAGSGPDGPDAPRGRPKLREALYAGNAFTAAIAETSPVSPAAAGSGRGCASGYLNIYSYIQSTTLTHREALMSVALLDELLCDPHLVHADAVEDAVRASPSEDDLAHLADTFQILASPTRLRIVGALTVRELCVCDLAAVVGVSQSAVSHHLRHLRQMRLVSWRKEGRLAYYRLDDDHVAELFRTGLQHVRE